MKALGIHSEGAVKLLAELLDLDAPGPYEEDGTGMRSISHTCVLLYSQYVLLNNCFARGIHVRALPVPIPFCVVQVCRFHVLFFLSLHSFNRSSLRPFFSSPSFCPASLPFPLPACVLITYMLLVSASTDRLGRRSYGASARWDSMYIAMYP
ncbi:hypothetical protein B0H11DRAFT_2108801 [Mycena galericulata]|nr:hypothetical protein B0H11DRAFT_2108801 [Mycena galericulata]